MLLIMVLCLYFARVGGGKVFTTWEWNRRVDSVGHITTLKPAERIHMGSMWVLSYRLCFFRYVSQSTEMKLR